MPCVTCDSAILNTCDNVSYSCRHRFHTACILTNKLALFKPYCPSCEKGKLIYIKCHKQDEADLANKKELELEQSRNNMIINMVLLITLLVGYFILKLRQ